jgi:hypothetical protein
MAAFFLNAEYNSLLVLITMYVSRFFFLIIDSDAKTTFGKEMYCLLCSWSYGSARGRRGHLLRGLAHQAAKPYQVLGLNPTFFFFFLLSTMPPNIIDGHELTQFYQFFKILPDT